MRKTLFIIIIAGITSTAQSAEFSDLAVSASKIKAMDARAIPAPRAAAGITEQVPAQDACRTEMSGMLGALDGAPARGTKADMDALFALRARLVHSVGRSACVRELVSQARHAQDDIGVSLLGGGTKASEPFKGDINVETDGPFSFPGDLRTGDVMLSRGLNLMGSVAARMSVTPGEYSHLGMVWRDPADGQVFILSSDSGVGAAVEPLAKFTAGRARLIVLRYEDEALARKAAELMHDRMLGGHIPYDYFMNYDDDSALYCTEVAAAAFRMAGGPAVPLELSRLPGGGRSKTYSNIGIRKPYVFVAQDAEVDPRFRVVAEWTDYARIGEMNRIDALYGKMAEWMDREDYDFSRNILNQALGQVLMVLGKKRIHDAVGDLPTGIGRDAVDYTLTIYQFMSLMQRKLDYEMRKSPGYHTLAEFNSALERIRLEEYKEYRDADLFGEQVPSGNMHLYLRPKRLK